MDLWKLNRNNGEAITDIDKEISYHNKRAKVIGNKQRKTLKSSPTYKLREYLRQRHIREVNKLNQRKKRINM